MGWDRDGDRMEWRWNGRVRDCRGRDGMGWDEIGMG